MMSLGDFLLEKRRENEDEMERGLKHKYIGFWGEIFAYNYLDNLFKRNNINYNIEPHKNDHEEFDLEIFVNGRSYKFEIKFSTKEKYITFSEIHFNNEFDYLLLIWHPSDNDFYFEIMRKEDARKIVTPMNTSREDEDNWAIQTTKIFDEENEKFLKKISTFLGINENLEDLTNEEKIYLIETAKEEIIKSHKDAEKNDFNGETYKQWFYDYLSNYVDEVELMPKRYKYDLNYKGKGIEIKYSSLHKREFLFEDIKPENFDYILFIAFDVKENKFYFELKNKKEYKQWKKEKVGSAYIFSRNGNEIQVGKSFFRFGNDFTFEDFDNYIKTH